MTRALALLIAATLLAPASLAQTRSAAPASADAALADVPDFLTYSGILTDADGAPLADGTYALTFRGYASETDAEPTWQERHEATVTAGQFWVVLGRHTPLADAADWYTVSVDGAPESAHVRLDAPGEAQKGSLAGNSLDQAYDEGQVINVDQGRPLVFRGAPGSFYTGLQIVDMTATLTSDELVRFRLRSRNGGASWEYRVQGAQSTGPTAPPPGSFSLSNASSAGAIDPFVIRPSATQGLLGLIESTVAVGDDSNPSRLQVYTSENPASPDNSPVTVELADHFGEGGRLRLFTEDGERYGEIEPLFSTGQGGYMRLDAPNGLTGFEISGGIGASGVRMKVGVAGVGQTVFDSGAPGTDRVQLPTDAVDATEILNEGGTANATNSGSIALTSGFNTTLVRSITAPTAGYVIALATSELTTNHTTGTGSFMQFAVSQSCDSPTAPPVTQQQNIQIPSSAPTGNYTDVLSVHGLFSVDAGTTTFCSVVQLINSTVGSTDDQNLTLLFVPTAYGGISSNVGEGAEEQAEAPKPALTAADVRAERTASVQANEARILAELDALRARVADMEARENRNGNER